MTGVSILNMPHSSLMLAYKYGVLACSWHGWLRLGIRALYSAVCTRLMLHVNGFPMQLQSYFSRPGAGEMSNVAKKVRQLFLNPGLFAKFGAKSIVANLHLRPTPLWGGLNGVGCASAASL